MASNLQATASNQGGTITLSNIGVIGTKEIFNLARHVFDVVVQIVVKIRS